MNGDPPVSGRLRDERLPKILTRLQRQKKTGTLILQRNDQKKFIFIKDGDIIFASSKYQDDWLGEVLLKIGKITLKQYQSASETVLATRKRLGTVLVEIGALSAKDLFWGVAHQVKEIILSLFTWLDGEYAFEEGPLPAQEVITLKMSTANLILAGIRRINDFTRLRNELPPLNTSVRVTADPMILFQDIRLSEPEWKVLAQIDGQKPVFEIFERSGLPAFETLKLLCFFFSIGLVEIPAAEPDRARPAQAGPSTEPEAAQKPSFKAPPGSADIPETPDAAAGEESIAEQQAAVEELLRRSDQEIRLTQQKILEAYDALSNQDHYAVLGLGQEATRDEIKRAYFRLAKVYHPDRHFQSGLEDLTPKLESLFRRITEAYDTLLMERKRKEYDTELTMKKFGGRRAEAAGPSAAEQAQLGLRALQKNELKTAAYYFEAAVKAAPDHGNYRALLAKALAQLPGRQRDAEAHYKQAVELEPANVEYYLGLGLLYKKSGMNQRAQRQFEEALIWDPDNPTAKEELKKLKAS